MATEIGRKEVVDAVTRAGIKDAEEVIPYSATPRASGAQRLVRRWSPATCTRSRTTVPRP